MTVFKNCRSVGSCFSASQQSMKFKFFSVIFFSSFLFFMIFLPHLATNGANCHMHCTAADKEGSFLKFLSQLKQATLVDFFSNIEKLQPWLFLCMP